MKLVIFVLHFVNTVNGRSSWMLFTDGCVWVHTESALLICLKGYAVECICEHQEVCDQRFLCFKEV